MKTTVSKNKERKIYFLSESRKIRVLLSSMFYISGKQMSIFDNMFGNKHKKETENSNEEKHEIMMPNISDDEKKMIQN
jgi:hypothetical protein